jgi:hypothetical protein
MANIKLNIKKRFFNEAYLPYLETTDRVNVFYGGWKVLDQENPILLYKRC